MIYQSYLSHRKLKHRVLISAAFIVYREAVSIREVQPVISYGPRELRIPKALSQSTLEQQLSSS